MIRLHYWFSRAGRGEQVRLLLAELGLAWEECDTEWNSDAWRALFPEPLAFAAQPAIVIDGFSLTQSAVILGYLARRFGIAPATPEACARADACVGSAEDLRMNLFRATSATDAPTARATFAETEWPNRWMAGLGFHLGPSGWLVGDHLTHADLAFWDAVDQAQTAIPSLVLPPAVAAWFEQIAARPRVAAYLASSRRPPR